MYQLNFTGKARILDPVGLILQVGWAGDFHGEVPRGGRVGRREPDVDGHT